MACAGDGVGDRRRHQPDDVMMVCIIEEYTQDNSLGKTERAWIAGQDAQSRETLTSNQQRLCDIPSFKPTR